MSSEMFWLIATLLMTALFGMPYILDRIVTQGVWPAMARSKPPEGVQSAWADRAIKAHENATENLVIFAPAVLAANALAISSPATRMAAAAYFFARLVHYVVYAAGIPVVRTLAYLVGLVANLVILASVLRWL